MVVFGRFLLLVPGRWRLKCVLAERKARCHGAGVFSGGGPLVGRLITARWQVGVGFLWLHRRGSAARSAPFSH